MNDNLIDKIIAEINADGGQKNLHLESYFTTNKEFLEYRSCISWLINEKIIIQPINNNSLLSLTTLGKKIVNKGGWIAFQAEKIKLERIENERQSIKDRSESFDLKIKEWTYKARYWPFIFSILALLGTVISLIITYKMNLKQHKDSSLNKNTEMNLSREDSLVKNDTSLNVP